MKHVVARAHRAEANGEGDDAEVAPLLGEVQAAAWAISARAPPQPRP
ncbi:hypothetical protein KKF91_21735 [Myxococcota bacterium]|nr:hypothetical protein [Myxococcota bacterium]MBU1433167.1 hypothetical protein [Myxococcota bacterium]MBU1899716.1 hypothetical protein [Myxococcota bacterium]